MVFWKIKYAFSCLDLGHLTVEPLQNFLLLCAWQVEIIRDLHGDDNSFTFLSGGIMTGSKC